MSFDEIAGNHRLKAILRLALERGRLPHALLFVGPPGVGKRATALTLAQALNCQALPADACGACVSCRAIEEGRFPDVLELKLRKKRENDGEDGEVLSEALRIEQFRELKNLAYLRPLSGRRRVFIWEADLMSAAASHSVLKVLEEPPATTTLILHSENPDLVLPTIRSRCQTLAFGPVAAEEIERVLRDRGCEDERARTLALIARGNLARALKLDGADVEKCRSEAWDAFRGLALAGDVPDFLRRFAFARRKDVKDDLAEMLELWSGFGRDLLLLQEGGPSQHLFNPDYRDGLEDLAAQIPPEAAVRFLGAIEGALTGLDRHLNTGLVTSVLAARMIG